MFKLRELLLSLLEYNEIFLDTPPAWNFYTRSVLIASERCLIPSDCDAFSHQVLYTLLQQVCEISSNHNLQLEVDGLVANQFQPRVRLPPQLLEEMLAEKLPALDISWRDPHSGQKILSSGIIAPQEPQSISSPMQTYRTFNLKSSVLLPRIIVSDNTNLHAEE